MWKDETTLHELDEYNFKRITPEEDKPAVQNRDFFFNHDLVSFRLAQKTNGHTFGVIVLSELIQIDEEEKEEETVETVEAEKEPEKFTDM